MSDGWSIASAIAGAAAALAAAWAGWSAARATKQTAKLVKIEQERRAEERHDREVAAVASRQARLLVETWKDDASAGQRFMLSVRNAGPATAMDLSVQLDPDDNNTQLRLPRANGARPFVLMANEQRAFTYTAGHGGIAAFICRLEWTDESGAHVDDRQMDLPTA